MIKDLVVDITKALHTLDDLLIKWGDDNSEMMLRLNLVQSIGTIERQSSCDLLMYHDMCVWSVTRRIQHMTVIAILFPDVWDSMSDELRAVIGKYYPRADLDRMPMMAKELYNDDAFKDDNDAQPKEPAS